eukprot:COSAG01_NODE_8676_length_2701_cov_1.212529_4_plen_240_part_01
MQKIKISVIGCGPWALTIAKVLAENGHAIQIWCHEQTIAEQINNEHTHDLLPNLKLPEHIQATHDLNKCLASCEAIIFGIASSFIDLIDHFPKTFNKPVLILTKGLLEKKNTIFVFEYLAQQLKNSCISILSGPNLALEIAEQKPAAAVVASSNEKNARFFQEALSNTYFRTYTSSDIKGVALGGILKNIMAIAGGCSDGLNLGMNSKSALLARSLQEIIRFGVHFGGQEHSFYGLSGLG